VGCDLITDAPLSRMADLHRSKSALFTCMLSGPQASGLMSNAVSGQANHASAEAADPRYLSSLIGEELLVALDLNSLTSTSTLSAGGSHGSSTSSCNLIYCQPQADALDDATNTYLPVKMSTLCRYPRLRLRTDLLDPHCYLFSSKIYEIIDEIAGWTYSGEEESAVRDALQQTVPASLFSFREDFIPRLMAKFHRFHSSQLAAASPPASFAFIVDSGHYCLRANTLPALLEASRQLLKLSSPSLVGTRIAASAEIPPRSQVGNDSMFGEGSRLGERSSIKKSAVGAGCVLGSNVKIVNSVVLDGVVIEDGCKLEGCIVGPKVVIREKSQLRDCDIAGGYVIEKETTAKGESFSQHRELTDDI
jgi:translation initiation factor eIF-2B subunit gamma